MEGGHWYRQIFLFDIFHFCELFQASDTNKLVASPRYHKKRLLSHDVQH